VNIDNDYDDESILMDFDNLKDEIEIKNHPDNVKEISPNKGK